MRRVSLAGHLRAQRARERAQAALRGALRGGGGSHPLQVALRLLAALHLVPLQRLPVGLARLGAQRARRERCQRVGGVGGGDWGWGWGWRRLRLLLLFALVRFRRRRRALAAVQARVGQQRQARALQAQLARQTLLGRLALAQRRGGPQQRQLRRGQRVRGEGGEEAGARGARALRLLLAVSDSGRLGESGARLYFAQLLLLALSQAARRLGRRRRLGALAGR